MSGSELERIEARQIALQQQQVRIELLLAETVHLLGKVVTLLEEPDTFPASTGGVITVK